MILQERMEIEREQAALLRSPGMSEATRAQFESLLADQQNLEELCACIFSSIANDANVKKFEYYTPGKKHSEYFGAGKEFPERLFTAANRCGKSTAGAYEDVCHLTGLYPEWWNGHRFHAPVNGVLIGNTARQLRSAAQQILFGPPGQWGPGQSAGMIPGETVIDIKTVHGVSGAIDFALIRHVPSGGTSTLFLCSAEQGWQALQGRKLQFIHCDEEPPANVGLELYSELVSRLIDSDGIFYMTATPQQGMTELMSLFWGGDDEGNDDAAVLRREGAQYRYLTRMEIWEAEHLTKRQIDRFVASIPPHQRDARLRGVPVLGGGMVWPATREQLFVDWFDITGREDLKIICGLDHGHVNSYFAAVWLLEDAEKTIYVYDAEKIRGEGLVVNAQKILERDNRFGLSVPVAWPRDMKIEHVSKHVPVEDYRKAGMNMLNEPAHFEDERAYCVEDGLELVRRKIMDGKFKVVKSPRTNIWMKEWELFAYDEEGEVVKTKSQQNDLMDATRYGVVMLYRGYGKRLQSRKRRNVQSLSLARPGNHWN